MWLVGIFWDLFLVLKCSVYIDRVPTDVNLATPLTFLRHHVRELSDVRSCPNVGHSQPDGGMPNKFPKRAGKGAGKLDKRPREPNTAPQRGPKQAHLHMLAKMLARHEMALQQLEADRSWVIFLDS